MTQLWGSEPYRTYSEMSETFAEQHLLTAKLILCPPSRHVWWREVVMQATPLGELNETNTIVVLPGLQGNDFSYVQTVAGCWFAISDRKARCT